MSTQINGLLTQKPDSPVPAAGNTQRFSWQEKTGKSGKPYIKIKNEGAEYGSECEIVTAEKTDFVDTHGNVSFNVSFIPQDGAGAVASSSNGRATAPAASDKDGQIARAVAFKGAIELATGGKIGNAVSGNELVAAIAHTTEALLPILTGAADPKAEPVVKTTEVPATKSDSDIPF